MRKIKIVVILALSVLMIIIVSSKGLLAEDVDVLNLDPFGFANHSQQSNDTLPQNYTYQPPNKDNSGPYSRSNTRIFLGILYLVLVTPLLLGGFWRAFEGSKPIPGEDGPLILSMYTNGASIAPLNSGTIGGFPFKLYITEAMIRESALVTSLGSVNKYDTEPDYTSGIAFSGRLLMIVDLPFISPVHAAAFGLKDKSFKAALTQTSADNALRQVSLEGDFPDYFRLYSEPSKEIELREVLDPAAMEFLVDYCKRAQWEIYRNNIYFAQYLMTGKDTDQENIVQDAALYIKQILPKIQHLNQTQSTGQNQA